MTKDDLVEAMARAIWEAKTGGVPWSAVKPEIRHLWHADAEAMLPYLVEFVAGWLETVPVRYEPEPRAWELARKWREEMGESAPMNHALRVRLDRVHGAGAQFAENRALISLIAWWQE